MDFMDEAFNKLNEDVEDDKSGLKDYALFKNCVDFSELADVIGEDELKEVIDETYDCLFVDGGYFEPENTTYKLGEDYIEVYVDGKLYKGDNPRGRYYISYDPMVGADRLYDYDLDEE